MARLRIETAPEITVYDEAFVIKAAANASAPLIQLKDSSGTVVGNITSTGTLNVASVVASNAGSSSTDLATRGYVDTVASGMNWHAAVEYATAAALPACTYANGTDGVGATLTGDANGRLTVDGSPQTTGKSVLVKNQADAKQNGIYYITAQGVDGSAPFVLTRRSDTNNSVPGQVKAGDAVYVIGGSNNGGQAFTLTSAGTGTGGAIVLGTDDLTYTQFTGTATFTAGAGLLATGNVVDVVTASSNRIVVNANNIDLATVAQTNTAGSNTTSFVSSLSVDSYGRITGTETSSVSFSGYATLANPALTGVPTAPTAANGTSDTQIATTNFVQNAATQAVSDAGNNAILKSLVDAKGDLIVGTADNTPARIGVGSNGQILKANSSTSTGVEWGSFSPVITLGGDLTGNVTLTNLGNATLTATIATNSVALGTDTTGNYVSDVSGGTGITVTHTPGEGSTPSIAINTSVTADLTTAQTLANKTFTTPNIGVATATSVNKVTITAPATSATLTLANGSSLITSGAFNTTFTATANTTVTLPTTGTLYGTASGSITSAQIATSVSDETGTGNLVFSNSPVLVTPNIGTPSYAVLSSATGLPISTGVSGLGTGVATFLATPTSANLATAVTDETGSGPLVFANSPTINTATLSSPVLTTPNIGTPSFANLASATNLPISTGVSGLGANIATFLATPSSANLASSLTDETGSGLVVFNTSPNINTSITTSSASFDLVNTNVTTLNFAGSATTLNIGNNAGNTALNGNVTVGGSLTVNGANTIINANTLVVSDKNIEMANISVQTNTAADGGGIILHGTTDKSILWYNASGAWTSSEDVDILTGKVYKINNTTVLSGTTLGSGVTGSSLTSFGTSPALTTPVISSGGASFSGSTSGTTVLKANATASGTITLPAVTGTVVTTGDTGTVTSTMIADATIVNADISTTAAIDHSKLATTTAGYLLMGNATGVIVGTVVSGDVTITNAGNVQIAAGAIVNADINSAAAIAYSKLSLSNSVVNADIATTAAIVYSKLSLTGSIVNADINSSAAIAYSKLSLANTIVNADIATTAAIAYSKLSLANSITNADIITTAAIAYSKLNLANAIVNADISSAAAIDQNKIADTTLNQQTASYTLVLTDKNKMVEISNASATTLTIPADNTVNMATGATLTILQTGAGQITIAGASGVTVNATPGLKLRTQWSSATLIKRAANTWVALGDLSA